MSLDIYPLINEANLLWENALAKNPNLKDKIYSDFRDKNNRQVIDLVQEGGGMLGIALVGYTYILEKAGLPLPWGEDFGAPHEQILGDAFEKPVFIHHMPSKIKAFYFLSTL